MHSTSFFFSFFCLKYDFDIKNSLKAISYPQITPNGATFSCFGRPVTNLHLLRFTVWKELIPVHPINFSKISLQIMQKLPRFYSFMHQIIDSMPQNHGSQSTDSVFPILLNKANLMIAIKYSCNARLFRNTKCSLSK